MNKVQGSLSRKLVFRETEFLQSIRKSNDFFNTPVMERKFNRQLRSFQELLLTEA